MALQNQSIAEAASWGTGRVSGGPAGIFSGSRPAMASEVAQATDFSIARYAQCWEDADVLLEALDIQPSHVCVSIASAGDNTLAMLARGPRRVIALDLSAAQLACLELRVAAYRELDHAEFLKLYGSLPSDRRESLYQRCRKRLSISARSFWDSRGSEWAQGIAHVGKFERYFERFRSYVLPLIHSRGVVAQLLEPWSREDREIFYRQVWDTWRWRLAFRAFFSRFVMGHLGRDPRFFRYAAGDVAGRLLERARYALTVLDPSTNPYLQWILTGRHLTALPFALRRENFEAIRRNLDRLEWRCQSLDNFLSTHRGRVDRCNLSDVFEYMSPEHYEVILRRIARLTCRGARIAYWNLFVRRERPAEMAGTWLSLSALAERLHERDQAFFYTRFVLEERR